ncbi:DUF2963 domain-containing protein [Candidatus Phytoplasma pruni]
MNKYDPHTHHKIQTTYYNPNGTIWFREEYHPQTGKSTNFTLYTY